MRNRLHRLLFGSEVLSYERQIHDRERQLAAYSKEIDVLTSKVDAAHEEERSLAEDLRRIRVDMIGAREAAEFWKQRAERWEEKFEASNTAGITARETVADFVSQLRFGRKIFDHSPVLPEKQPDDFKPIMKTRMQARGVVQEAERAFAEQLRQYQKGKEQEATPEQTSNATQGKQ